MFKSRLSCAIFKPDTDTVIVTGGRDPTMDRVFEYGNTGLMDEKASLQIGRYNHGCTSFSSDSKSVRNNKFLFLPRILISSVLYRYWRTKKSGRSSRQHRNLRRRIQCLGCCDLRSFPCESCWPQTDKHKGYGAGIW